MSSRSVPILLDDILDAMQRIEQYTAGMEARAFERDGKTVDAVVRNCAVIGEAANRIPTDFKDTHQYIPWVQIVGLRNRIVHEYFGIDINLVWEIISSNMPTLKAQLQQLRDNTLAESNE